MYPGVSVDRCRISVQGASWVVKELSYCFNFQPPKATPLLGLVLRRTTLRHLRISRPSKGRSRAILHHCNHGQPSSTRAVAMTMTCPSSQCSPRRSKSTIASCFKASKCVIPFKSSTASFCLLTGSVASVGGADRTLSWNRCVRVPCSLARYGH